MPITKFPDPRGAEDGIVALGGDIQPESLLLAYRNGIFPWPDPSFAMMIWASPVERGILEFKDLHLPRSLIKACKKLPYRCTIDNAFEAVIAHCAALPRPDQDGTWITKEMMRAYERLHQMGYVHSVECWDGDTLVGGLYGVCIDGVFAGESMFYIKPYASKFALLHIIEHLKSRGAEWMDIQMLTPHMQALGAKAISREEFLDKLKATQKLGLKLF